MPETSNVERLLGVLMERTENIRSDIAEVKASLTRRERHGHEIEMKLDSLDERLGEVETAMGKAAPILGDIERWRERGRGMLLMWGLLVTTFGMAAAGAAKHVWTIIRPHLGFGG